MNKLILLIKNIPFAICILVVCFSISSFAFAWSSPTGSPQTYNIPAPLNTSSTSQYKVGSLGLGVSPLSKLDVSGATAIGTYAGTTAAPSNGLIVSGNVGVGTNSPTTNLDVNGTIRIRGGSPATGYLITALDSNGNATWAPPPENLQGPTGTVGPSSPSSVVCMIADYAYSLGYVYRTSCVNQTGVGGCTGNYLCQTITCQTDATTGTKWVKSNNICSSVHYPG